MHACPTLFGKLAHYILKEETAQVTKTLAVNCPKFQEMVDSNLLEIDKWAYRTANSIFWGISRHIRDGSKLSTVDETITEAVLDDIRQELLGVQEEESIRRIEELAKVKWIRELAIKETDTMIEWHKIQTQMSKKLRDTLTKINNDQKL